MAETVSSPRRRSRLAGTAGALAVAFATLAPAPPPGGAVAQTAPGAPPSSPLAVPLARPAGPADFADLAARVTPAVVGISVVGRAEALRMGELPPELRGTPLEEFLRRFFGDGGGPDGPAQPRGRRTFGLGSGFLLDPQGHIVTAHHVVGNAERVTVELHDGRELPARVVGTDPQTDIALLKIEAREPLPHVPFGDSDALRVGEWVLAMGNPFGLGETATAGIVSARGRQIGAGPYDDFIQTDAPINPGNSGGPLFNTRGEVVGINTAIFSPSGGNIGIGFAVPSNLARRIVAELRDHGRVERGWLGVSLQPLDADLAQALGLPEAKGALIAAVEPGSPAARAGLQPGDVVVAAGGQPVERPRDLANAVATAKPGSTLALAIVRAGRRLEQQVGVGEPPGQQAAAAGERARDRREAESTGPLGLLLAPRRGVPPGQGGAEVVRVLPGSVAEERGLRPGDVILRAGDRAVQSPRDVAEAVNAAREAGRPAVALQIQRGENRAFLALPLNRLRAAEAGSGN
ncbi:DegQ family serine endoprotease [Caldovatus aquaticus]|uniref:DegQ family serine endoprotease n=1 Tax=Caldovatus aquaticus TaxID=2865671 RepID=A0ABS7EZ72_9PROT|nr:DegQ family serine endoprotease [Caldovatus aquaticus]MBW8268667.1 DegQ family serine endoprotease [Caldovatus aquaticus]